MPALPIDPDPRDAQPGGGDDGTDPGHGHPYESLYRSASGEPAKPMRPKARHWEPSLRPPDGEHQGFGWLYREEPQPGGQVGPADPPPPDGPFPPADPPPPDGPFPPADPPPPTGPPPPSSFTPEPPVTHRHRPRAGRVVLLLLVAVVLGAVVAVVVNAVVTNRDPGLFRGDETSAAPTSAGPSAVALNAVAPAQVTASCQASNATDDAGAPVSYGPGNVADLDPSTAWRCPGSGVGQSITFRFAEPVNLAQVGLINGYAKVDPTSGVHRYGEYRRVTKVTWALPDGVAFQQTLTDGVETVQQLNISARTTNQVTLTVDSTTTPGSDQANRDAMLLSEVSFAAAP